MAVCALCLGFTACSDDDDDTDTQAESTENTDTIESLFSLLGTYTGDVDASTESEIYSALVNGTMTDQSIVISNNEGSLLISLTNDYGVAELVITITEASESQTSFTAEGTFAMVGERSYSITAEGYIKAGLEDFLITFSLPDAMGGMTLVLRPKE